MATVRAPAVVKPSEGVRYVTAIIDQIGTSGSPSTVYTSPANHVGLLRAITISNSNAAAREVTVTTIRNSQTGTPSDIWIDADSLDGNSVVQLFDLGHTNATDVIEAFSSAASSVDITLYIEEYQFQSGL